MNTWIKPVLAALVIAATPMAAFAADEDRAAIRTELQVAMQRHIGRTVVDGQMTHIDLTTGALTQLYPTQAHPMVLAGDGFYVLCSDLASADGSTLDVDYYMVESARGYRVFRTEIDNRSVLHLLMEAGDVAEY